MLRCPPVEYIKTWSTIMYHSLDTERFEVHVRDGKRQITMSKDFDKVVVNAFFTYIYTAGNLVQVLETLESPSHPKQPKMDSALSAGVAPVNPND